MAEPDFSPVLVMRQRSSGRPWDRGIEIYTASGEWVGTVLAYTQFDDDDNRTMADITIRVVKARITTDRPEPERETKA